MCLSLSVSVCLCLSLSVFVFLCVPVCFCVFLCVNLCHIHIVRMQRYARCMFFRHSYGPFIASTLPLRKLMLRVDDRSRLYADALQRQSRPQLMLRVDDLCRFNAQCIIASWYPGFSLKSALPIGRKAFAIGTGSVIVLPTAPILLLNAPILLLTAPVMPFLYRT